jgi:hypothetical protein
MKYRYFFYLFFLIVLSSCSVLSDSQLKNINIYATAAASYSNYPGSVIREYAALSQNNRVLKSSGFKDVTAIDQGLSSASDNYNLRINLASQFDLSLQLFQQYVGLLAKLSAVNFVDDLGGSTKLLGESSTSLVNKYNEKATKKLPAEVGNKLADAVFIVGKRWVKTRQAKALKSFIPNGDLLVASMVDNLVAGLEGGREGSTSLKDLISLGKSDFKDKYTIIVLNKPEGINFNNVKTYYETLNRFDSLETMRAQCVVTANKIKVAHHKLAQDIQRKRKLKDVFDESTALIADVQKLKKAFEIFVD